MPAEMETAPARRWNVHYTREVIAGASKGQRRLYHMLIQAPTLRTAAQAWEDEYNDFPDAVLVEVTRAAAHIRELPDLTYQEES